MRMLSRCACLCTSLQISFDLNVLIYLHLAMVLVNAQHFEGVLPAVGNEMKMKFCIKVPIKAKPGICKSNTNGMVKIQTWKIHIITYFKQDLLRSLYLGAQACNLVTIPMRGKLLKYTYAYIFKLNTHTYTYLEYQIIPLDALIYDWITCNLCYICVSLQARIAAAS